MLLRVWTIPAAFPPRVLMLLVAMLFASSAAHAVDGVIEINQVIAIQQGIGTGDNPGFPVSIAQSGSYRLTSDLRVSSALGQPPDAVVITADDVTLDLNGFTIRCVPSPILPVSCVGQGGGGDGIQIQSATGVRIHSGNIRGFPQHGVNGTQTFTAYVIDRVLSTENGVNGIESAGRGQIFRSQFIGNGTYGIHGRAFSDLVLDVYTEDNGTAGIHDLGSAMAIGRSQFRDGISAIPNTQLLDCIINVFAQVCP